MSKIRKLVKRLTWRSVAGLALVLAICSVPFIPVDQLRTAGTFWAGATVFVCLYFVVGYLWLSRPTRNDEGRIEDEWWWLLAENAVIGSFMAYIWVFRLITPAAAAVRPEQIVQFRVSVVIFMIAFFLQFWISAVWTYRQVSSRRALSAGRKPR